MSHLGATLPYLPVTLSFSSSSDAGSSASSTSAIEIARGTLLPCKHQFQARMTSSPAVLQVFADGVLIAEVVSISEEAKLSECPVDTFNVIVDVLIDRSGATNVAVTSKNTLLVTGEVLIAVA